MDLQEQLFWENHRRFMKEQERREKEAAAREEATKQWNPNKCFDHEPYDKKKSIEDQIEYFNKKKATEEIEEEVRNSQLEPLDFGLADITIHTPEGPIRFESDGGNLTQPGAEPLKIDSVYLREFMEMHRDDIAQMNIDHGQGEMEIQFLDRPELITIRMTDEQKAKFNEAWEQMDKTIILQPQYANPKPQNEVPVRWNPKEWEVVRFSETEGRLDLKRKEGTE